MREEVKHETTTEEEEEEIIEEESINDIIEEIKRPETPKEVVVKPEYPDMRPRVEELEAEMAKMKLEMESAHQNEVNQLNMRITELETAIEDLELKLKRDVSDKDELIAKLQKEN